MIQKIQTLQKRLIGKTEEVVEKDLLIQVSVVQPGWRYYGATTVVRGISRLAQRCADLASSHSLHWPWKDVVPSFIFCYDSK